MAIGLRDFEVFRGEPKALPGTISTAYERITGPKEILRVVKIDQRTPQEQIVGAYTLTFPDDPSLTARLGMLLMLPAYRGNGIGRWLVGHAIGVSETKGARALITEPGCAGTSAIFQRMGFAKIGEAESWVFQMFCE